jgi:Lhr-like helicase
LNVAFNYGGRAEILDGDTPAHRRAQLKEDPPHILVSNPDILHLSLLPYHPQWKAFWERLRFVVLDELHTYKGIFGSHVAHVLRRPTQRQPRLVRDEQLPVREYLLATLDVFVHMVSSLHVRGERMRSAAGENHSLSTDIADLIINFWVTIDK